MWPSVRPVFAPFRPTTQLDVWSRKPDPLSPSFEAMCVPCSQWLNRPRRPWMTGGDAVPRLSRDSRWRRKGLLPCSGQGAQEDALRFWVDVLDLGNRDDQEAPAETAGANDECVRPILAGGIAQPLDLAEEAVRRVDAEALAAAQPVVGVEPGVPGQVGVSAQGGSLHRSP
jgi:hypothetical protein